VNPIITRLSFKVTAKASLY